MQLRITAEPVEKLLRNRNCYESSDNLYLCKVLKASLHRFYYFAKYRSLSHSTIL